MEKHQIIEDLTTLKKSLEPVSGYFDVINELDKIITKIKDSKNRAYELSNYNIKQFEEWNKKHVEECHKGKEPYSGCIGGRLTFSFTDTSLGEIQTVSCGLCSENGRCVNCRKCTKCRGPKDPLWKCNLTDWDNFG